MKNIKITFVLILLSFKLFAQIDYPENFIVKNKISKISKYLVIPKTNPNYYKKPIGLMLESEFLFDNKGHMISTFSPKGAVASHSDSKDIKQYYFYKDDKIVKMSRVDFDSISIEYMYFDKEHITFKIKTNDKKERIGLELIYNDASNGKEIKKVEIDFHNTTELNNSIHTYETNIIYSKNIKRTKKSRKLFKISAQQINVLKSSFNIQEIDNELSKIEKGFLIDSVIFNTTYIYNKQNQLIKEISEDSSIEYFYNKKGLLLSCKDKNKRYSFISKFIYSKK